jgi:hypothetical protein
VQQDDRRPAAGYVIEDYRIVAGDLFHAEIIWKFFLISLKAQ